MKIAAFLWNLLIFLRFFFVSPASPTSATCMSKMQSHANRFQPNFEAFHFCTAGSVVIHSASTEHGTLCGHLPLLPELGHIYELFLKLRNSEDEPIYLVL